jgi:hypothetical protein
MQIPITASNMFQVHYMFGSTFPQQTKHLRWWIVADAATGPGPAKLDFIVSVMFWETGPSCPQASSYCSVPHIARTSSATVAAQGRRDQLAGCMPDDCATLQRIRLLGLL